MAIKKAPKGLVSWNEAVEVHEHERQHWNHENQRADESLELVHKIS
jgi:hypothetical protein